MVSRSYMLDASPAPSRLARYVHWHATPAAINGLSSIEEQMESLRAIIRQSPLPIVLSAFAFGVLFANRRNRV